jgi:hypothetical protein
VSINPYQPPSSAQTDPVGTDAAVSNRIVEALRKAKPWASLVAISWFVVAGFSVLSGLLLFAAPASKADTTGIAVGFLVWGGITFGAALPLHRYTRRIRKLLHGGGMLELELALEAQTRFWQLAGVITLISILFLMAAITLGVFATALIKSL